MEIFVFYKYFEIPSFIGKKGKNVGIWQKEGYPFARNVIREAIYNAIVHNCYMYGTPVQIRIEESRLSLATAVSFLRDGLLRP